ncbi:S-adenosyl-L-methionine-dependent methyltransferase [Crepidotus variabilis]|uniref:S-adenosyl-L-methionine-dependent methyltransferase n=1 Tax=Crepidotus variabilis TaxID=179855 RepID=A0A9P6EGL0_9AGAR|nr:S-adenosyl-L-methionine-dependent methyltransferase [Crepidotus variabilis]
MSSLLASLAKSLRSQSQAAREFKWMQQHISQHKHSPDIIHEYVRRRTAGEPLQYILGTQPFGPLNLLARPPVLIPRPETEHWVCKLAESFTPTAQKPISLLDLGTGSGCIPLLLCNLWPQGSVKAHAVDISPHALKLATDNAQLCGMQSSQQDHQTQNTFSTSMANFLAETFPDTATRSNAPFDIITSNPPYIPWNEYLELPRSVQDFEDPRALFGGPSGFNFYHAIARLISKEDILKPSGIVVLEVGHDQAKKVESLMLETGRFRRTEIWSDPWEKQRTVVAHM